MNKLFKKEGIYLLKRLIKLWDNDFKGQIIKIFFKMATNITD